MNESQECPCGSGRVMVACCGRYISGQALPDTAEQLMRSRYVAYVLQDENYLKETWHPDTRPEVPGAESTLQWLGLTIISVEEGEDENEAWVEFVARYKDGGRAGRLQERSRFLRMTGRWCYVDGEMKSQPEESAVSRNGPCPCGSGKKFKRCCG